MELEKYREYDGVVSIFPSKKMQVLTTKSWGFIGFPQHVERANYESDIIIGVIDTGIWPESESFNDEGFGPPPRKWKGTCQTSNVTCNNKLIGARYFRVNDTIGPNDIKSPRDTNGHGTHTASIAAGNDGPNSSSIFNVAPWSIAVAAGTIDRKFITKVQLGDNTTYVGISINTFDLKRELYPLIFAGDAPNIEAGFDKNSSSYCPYNSLNHKLVSGKIVLCGGVPDELEVFRAGVVGVLTCNPNSRDVAYPSPVPNSMLELEDAAHIYHYIKSTRYSYLVKEKLSGE